MKCNQHFQFRKVITLEGSCVLAVQADAAAVAIQHAFALMKVL